MKDKKGFNLQEDTGIYGAKMKVIGVGGGGGNMINHMIASGHSRIDLIVANTDAQALNHSLCKNKVRLGEKTTNGLGAGMDPETGKRAAEEAYDIIKDTLDGSDIVFIGAGMGGGTGTGAAPIVARAAKEIGSLAIGIVTTPFQSEGKKRAKLAREGLEELQKECDSIIVIPNENLIGLIAKNASKRDGYKLVDNVLARAVAGMASIILDYGDVNVDFADVKRVMSYRGVALLGLGEGEGDNAALEAVKNAIQSPLLGDIDLKGSKGVLLLFRHSPDCPLLSLNEAANFLHDKVSNEDADIIQGYIETEDLPINKVEVTIIATGFGDSSEPTKQPVEENKETASKPAPEVERTKPNQDIWEIMRSQGGIKNVSNGDPISVIEDVPAIFRHQQD